MNIYYMSQMLYAGQSARPSVPFFNDFQQLQRAQFMYQVHEILIHESQPICNPFGQILWSWVVLGLIYGRSNFCHTFYQVPHQRPDLLGKIYGKILTQYMNCALYNCQKSLRKGTSSRADWPAYSIWLIYEVKC